MTTKFSIIIKFTNGEATTFKDVANFQVMDQGVFFVEGIAVKKEDKIGRILRGIETKIERYWYPMAIVKEFKVYTTRTITEPEEVRKYEAFLKHGIDITVTKISHTNEPDEKAVSKLVERELKSEKTN